MKVLLDAMGQPIDAAELARLESIYGPHTMTDTPTPNDCPGYEITVSIRAIDGQLVHRTVLPVVWQLDAFATRDDGKWSQDNKATTLSIKLDEAVRTVRTWLKGREL
jgi:hypothetical protein